MKAAATLLCLVLLLTACNPDTDRRPAVPRHKAYPRLNLPSRSYKKVDGLPLMMEINAASSAAVDRNDGQGLWLTVDYPSLSAKVYYTFTPVTGETSAAVIDNRVERIAINLGGNAAEITEFTTPAGMAARVVTAGSAATPVQFIATDDASVVVSGTAYVEGLTAATRDSLAPAVALLNSDIIHSLQSMRRR